LEKKLAYSKTQGVSAPATNKWLILLVVSLGTAMSALDGGIVNVAYPQMTKYFNVPISTISWVALTYSLTSTAFLTTFGRLGDIFGRKWLYIGGLGLFSLGSLMCAFSPNIWVLFLARGIEGVGVAMALANSIALISEVFPREQRGMAIGVLETAVAVALTLGPTLGGFIISSYGWQGIFFVNLPIGAVNIVLASVVLRNAPQTNKVPNLDLPGTFSFGIAIAILLLTLTQAPDQGWTSLFTLVGFGLFGLVLALFVIRERTTSHPAVDLNLFFANRQFASASSIKILAYNAFATINFMMPFYFTWLLGFNSQMLGLAVIPFSIAFAVGSLTTSMLADRFPARLLASLGLFFLTVSTLTIGLVSPSVGYWLIAGAMIIGGLGMGLFITPNDKTIMNAAPPDRLGVAASTLALTRSLGFISGVALSGTLYSLVAGSKPGEQAVNTTLATSAFQLVFVVTAVLCLTGAILIISFIRKDQS
jgi:EmrB/QacA subfamily drug resistance transporter